MSRGKDEKAGDDEAQGGARVEPIDQVRELLFGATKRETDGQLSVLETRLEELRAEFLARFSELESRLADLARDAEKNQAASVDAIGGAIAQLGATIQNMSARRKG